MNNGMETLNRRSRTPRRCKHLRVESIFLVTALLLGALSTGSMAAPAAVPPALKQIDKGALATMLDATTRQLLVPGAVVLLRTPQGNFTLTSGTTVLGGMNSPRSDTYFRIASNTKMMTSRRMALMLRNAI